VDLSGTYSKIDATRNESVKYSSNPTGFSGTGDISQKETRQDFAISVELLYRKTIVKTLSCYLGIGPVLSFSRRSAESSDDTKGNVTTEAKYTYEFTTNSTGFGFLLSVGAEAFVTPDFGVLTEYRFSGIRTSERASTTSRTFYSTSSEERTYDFDRTLWVYSLNTIRVGLVYHF
jgi:opacity protein-like surface antigen